jgi:uncharacterized protein with HEPN domain
MKKNNLVYLENILDSAKQIIEYCEGYDHVKFANSKLVQDAVIRNLEIIGEAAKKLSPDFRTKNPDLPIKEAIGMRNLLVHEYDYVNVDEVWKVIVKDLPSLVKKLEDIIKT